MVHLVYHLQFKLNDDNMIYYEIQLCYGFIQMGMRCKWMVLELWDGITPNHISLKAFIFLSFWTTMMTYHLAFYYKWGKMMNHMIMNEMKLEKWSSKPKCLLLVFWYWLWLSKRCKMQMHMNEMNGWNVMGTLIFDFIHDECHAWNEWF